MGVQRWRTMLPRAGGPPGETPFTDLVVAPYSRLEVLGLSRLGQRCRDRPRPIAGGRGPICTLALPVHVDASLAIVNSIVLLASCVCLLHSP